MTPGSLIRFIAAVRNGLALVIDVTEGPREKHGNGFYYLTLLWYDGSVESGLIHSAEFELINQPTAGE